MGMNWQNYQLKECFMCLYSVLFSKRDLLGKKKMRLSKRSLESH